MTQLNDRDKTVVMNLTGVHITLITPEGEPIEIRPEYNEPLFLKPEHEKISKYLARTIWEPIGPVQIPQPIPGVLFIVSKVVKSAFPGRDDFVTPANIEKRGEQSRVICRRFAI